MTYQLSPETLAACKEVFDGRRSVVLRIADEVSAATGIPFKAIIGRDRMAPVARARQIVMYEAHLIGLSYPQIARALGMHHTSVMHGVHVEKKRRGL